MAEKGAQSASAARLGNGNPGGFIILMTAMFPLRSKSRGRFPLCAVKKPERLRGMAMGALLNPAVTETVRLVASAAILGWAILRGWRWLQNRINSDRDFADSVREAGRSQSPAICVQTPPDRKPAATARTQPVP
ncbi:MAG TPA: hypothetical protein VHM91_04365 [Verrucomicrobiales bacterium]|nr:hypothetical protein [Verrucomicrobiales bacterium]